jgi:hypothetical protein
MSTLIHKPIIIDHQKPNTTWLFMVGTQVPFSTERKRRTWHAKDDVKNKTNRRQVRGRLAEISVFHVPEGGELLMNEIKYIYNNVVQTHRCFWSISTQRQNEEPAWTRVMRNGRSTSGFWFYFTHRERRSFAPHGARVRWRTTISFPLPRVSSPKLCPEGKPYL